MISFLRNLNFHFNVPNFPTLLHLTIMSMTICPWIYSIFHLFTVKCKHTHMAHFLVHILILQISLRLERNHYLSPMVGLHNFDTCFFLSPGLPPSSPNGPNSHGPSSSRSFLDPMGLPHGGLQGDNHLLIFLFCHLKMKLPPLISILLLLFLFQFLSLQIFHFYRYSTST